MRRALKKLLTDTFEVKGIWYLPGSSMTEESVKGILRYSPNEITLELIGTFHGHSFVDIKDPSSLTIYGFSDHGEWFTLLHCLPAQALISAPGFDTITYAVAYFYAGTQLVEDESAALVKNASFSLTNLDAWLDYKILKQDGELGTKKLMLTIDPNAFAGDRKQLHIRSRDLKLSEEIRYNLVFPKEAFLGEKTEIIVQRFYRFSSESEDLLSPKYLYETIQQLRQLLTLLIGYAMYFSYIEFQFPNTTETTPDGKEIEHKHFCRIFFSQAGDPFKSRKRLRDAQRAILIKRYDLNADMESVFDHWFQEQEQLSEIASPYISDLYLPAYVENKYLNVVRGLETYHRFFINSPQEDDPLDSDRASILSFINENIPEANRDHFIKRVCYEDEKSFRKRLKNLFHLVPANLVIRLFGEMNATQKNKLISTIVDTRNYFTHRDDKAKYANIVGDDKTLDVLTDQLSVLLQYFCLTRIGIDPAVVEQRLLDQLH